MKPLLALLLFTGVHLTAADRRLAITIDDVPRSGDRGSMRLADVSSMTGRLLRPFREQHLPVIGFVNAQRGAELGPGGLEQILDLWLGAGAELGNHSYSHFDINNVPLSEYTADIVKGEAILRAALARHGKMLRYYRHPFLHTGATPEVRAGLQRFLDEHDYRVAPVTLDNSDYEFAALYTKPRYRDRVRREYVPYMESIAQFFERRSIEVVRREVPQILLLHASELNADLMPDLLAMFRRRGYRFVSLDEALADGAYRRGDSYAGRRGLSWIHRWALTGGLPLKNEPDVPEWVRKAWAAQSSINTPAPTDSLSPATCSGSPCR